MRSIGLLLCLSLLICPATGASAKPAYVLTTANLRAAPGTANEIVAKIPGGSLVDATNCTDGWCAVTWQEKRGFAIQAALDLSGRVPARRAGPPAYGPRDGYVLEEDPPVYYDGGPPPPGYYYAPYYGPYYYGGHYRRWRRW
jgi:hypothetical protein